MALPLLVHSSVAAGKPLGMGRKLDRKLVVGYTGQLEEVHTPEDGKLDRIPELGHRRRQQVDHSCLDTPQ